MVFAAGVGSRLAPLTEQIPKALVKIRDVPLIESVIRRLIQAGVGEIVINVFYLADMVIEFLKSKDHFGIKIEISLERELLETGGGLKKVANFFNDGQPFFVHNADVVSDIDLRLMYERHQESGNLSTLAVQERQSQRYFLFDRQGLLCGWEGGEGQKERRMIRPITEEPERLAFCGVHVISPEIFPKITEHGVFSITRTYLRLAGQGEKIQAFRSDPYFWKDIGTWANLKKTGNLLEDPELAKRTGFTV